MAKNILQDIVPPEKRSIRNIPVPARRRPFMQAPQSTPREFVNDVHSEGNSEAEDSSSTESDNNVARVYPYNEEVGGGTRRPKKGIWIVSGVVLVILLLTIFSLFTSATVTVTPNKETLSGGNTVFSAYQGDHGAGVPYTLLKITKNLGQIVPATGEVSQSTKASGQIIIYNNYSTSAQKLVANTRFETPEGLIFRIDQAVVVPGKSTKNGIILPGSLAVTVYADQPGDAYNIPLKDFTIPGLKNDPSRYKYIYARSKTPMTGGFVGTVKNVSPSDLATAEATIDANLKVALMQEVASDVSTSSVVFPDGIFTTFSSLPQSQGSDKSVQVNEQGTLTAIVFDQSALTSYIEQTLGSKYVGAPNHIASISTLPFAIQNKATFDPNRDTLFTFTLSGDINVVADFDQAKLASDLAGKPKSSIEEVLGQYPGIASIRAVISPFWKGSFPTDPKKISIVIAK
jgi:hypothetical protein